MPGTGIESNEDQETCLAEYLQYRSDNGGML